MSYVKHDFITWLQSKRRSNGEPYSEETISNYVSAIETYAEKLDNIQFKGVDLFKYDTLDKFSEIKGQIISHENFSQFNVSRHRVFTSALKVYQQFLSEYGTTSALDQQSRFEEWLRNYPEHRYIDSTIKRYITALKKAEKWLGITLTKQVMSTSSLEEFMEVQEQIKGANNYNVINQNHGHGDLSAALRAYQKFISAGESPSAGEEETTEDQSGGEEEVPVSIKETIDSIKLYIADRGFSYNEHLIENFYLSLKTKPFVILAGTSGTGKTRLVRLFAEAISAEYQLVAVRPDWSDSSDLFGHVDLNGNFIPGPVLEFMNRAKIDKEKKPYILCLDEMNLARVEYYLSDILSIMETREEKDGVITSDPILNESYYGKKDTAAAKKYGIQCIPENFYLVGTVNMDETTFPFSRKVLDRANTIEFSYVDLDNPEFGDPVKPNPENLPNSFLKTKYLFLRQCVAEEEYVKGICSKLQSINEILQKAEAHVGYRVRDEIVFYMLNHKNDELLDENDAFDNEIMQKILPRIQGSTASVKKLLCSLFVECAGSYSDSNDSDSKNMEKYLKDKKDKNERISYPKSAEKIMFMTRRFEEDGFTSYWL